MSAWGRSKSVVPALDHQFPLHTGDRTFEIITGGLFIFPVSCITRATGAADTQHPVVRGRVRYAMYALFTRANRHAQGSTIWNIAYVFRFIVRGGLLQGDRACAERFEQDRNPAAVALGKASQVCAAARQVYPRASGLSPHPEGNSQRSVST
jgi:hypothetical protein